MHGSQPSSRSQPAEPGQQVRAWRWRPGQPVFSRLPAGHRREAGAGLFHPAPSPCPSLISGQEGACFKSRPQPAGRYGARCRFGSPDSSIWRASRSRWRARRQRRGGGRRGAAQHEQLPPDQVRQDPRRRSGTLSCGAGVVAAGARRARGQEARAQRSSPAGSRGVGRCSDP